jgi:hypothetical protein
MSVRLPAIVRVIWQLLGPNAAGALQVSGPSLVEIVTESVGVPPLLAPFGSNVHCTVTTSFGAEGSGVSDWMANVVLARSTWCVATGEVEAVKLASPL